MTIGGIISVLGVQPGKIVPMAAAVEYAKFAQPIPNNAIVLPKNGNAIQKARIGAPLKAAAKAMALAEFALTMGTARIGWR